MICKDQYTLIVSNPLSQIRSCSSAFVTWYLSGNTGISSLHRGAGGKSLSFRCEWIIPFTILIHGRLKAAVSEIFWREAPKIYWGVSCVACDFCFIDAFIFVTSIWFCDVGWECALISPASSSLYEALLLLYTAPYVAVHIPRTEDYLIVPSGKHIGNHFELPLSHLFQLL